VIRQGSSPRDTPPAPRRRCSFACALLALALAASPVAAQEPDDDDNPLNLRLIETPDLKLVYLSPWLDYLTPHAIRSFTNAQRWQRDHFGWVPSQPLTVFLKDFADYGNAGATTMPVNALRIEVSPSSNAFETNPSSERMYSLMNHELVHIANGDIANADDRFWRSVFLGKVSPESAHPESLLYSALTVPRFNVPRWLLEGSAVFMETWMGGGLGRAQGGYDEMVFRAMVRDGAPFYDPLGLESRGIRVDFQVGVNAYLYGTRFISWLAMTRSPEQLLQWLRRDQGSERRYDEAFKQVFGLSLDEAWQQWIAYEREFQQRNLAELRKLPITPMKPLVPRALGSTSRTFYDANTRTLYGAYRQAGIVEHIGALSLADGSLRRLVDIKGGALYSVTSLAFDPVGRRIFFTADNNSRRSLMAYDLDSGEEQMLLKEARIGEIVFDASDRSLIGVRHENGLASLVRVPYPYVAWQTLHEFAYGVVPTDLDVSPDGTRLSASVGEVNGDQFLRVWSLPALRERRLEQLREFGFGQAFPESFVFSPDGRYLFGSSYFTGVSNIFRCDLANGEMEPVTNAETGVFRPLPLADGRLVVQAYTGQGFLPAVIEQPQPLKDLGAIRFLGSDLVERHPVLKSWQVPPPSTVDEDKLITRRDVYRPLREMALDNAYPVLQGYKDSGGIGYTFNWADPLGYASVQFTAAYTPDGGLPSDERGHLELRGDYLGWSGSLAWNRSDFYDLFGPTKSSRKGTAIKLGYDHALIYEKPRRLDFRFEIAHYDDIDTLPVNQNVASGVTRLSSIEAGLYYTHVRRSLGAVDDEKGLASQVVLSANYADQQLKPQLRGGFDFGIALPWEHASLWSRSAAGVAQGESGDTLASFYFGGFGNNIVDKGSVKRYRDYDSMPGFEIGEIAALSFVRETIELNLPPMVFESLGRPGLHLSWLRPALFATGLWTDRAGVDRRQNFASAGAQVDLRFSVMHWYEMIFSLGYGVGYRGGQRAGDEWMVSLKIM